ncbi:leucine-rich-repeats and calponin homology domain protein isoform X2 [Amblyomma americanum]
MATALASQPASSSAQLTRALERLFEDAQHTGELRLNGRKLKELPAYANKYDLRDIVHADLSRNRLSELPAELCGLVLLEYLDCHSNVVRLVPPAVAALQALTYLDLSRNQLSVLPSAVCQLPLVVLLVSNNRLQELPEELGRLRSLMDLDMSCNELSWLPPGIGELQALRSLRARRNRLLELPSDLCRLRLWRLDVSENQLARLPPLLRLMTSLRHLQVDGNPLVSPPAFLCRRGQVHVFKYLELEAVKEDRRRGHMPADNVDGASCRNTPVEQQGGHLGDGVQRPPTLDSGYNTAEGTNGRWSFEGTGSSYSSLEEERFSACTSAIISSRLYSRQVSSERSGAVHSLEDGAVPPVGPATPSTLSPSSETGAEHSPQVNGPPEVLHSRPVDQRGVSPPRLSKEGGPLRRVHQQTYREFKEALRLQRMGLAPPPPSSSPPSAMAPEEEFRVRHEAIVQQQRLEAAWAQQRLQQPPSPPPGSPLLPVASDGVRTPPRPSHAAAPLGGDFTIRRGLERAREEHELIEQLRWVIESRLKVQLPTDMGPALVDGVVLCHLANQVQPRSVASIHVPSAATPKLTLAKCRRNVENFLTACRQLGVPDGDLFAWEDLVLRVDVGRVAATVAVLVPGRWLPQPCVADRSLACLLLATLAGTCLLLLHGWPPPNEEWSLADLWLPVGLCCSLYLHACLSGRP